MNSSSRLYGWMKVVAVLHILEQLKFGMQDIRVLKGMIAGCDRWFGDPKSSHLVLAAICVALTILAIGCIARGGRSRLVALIALSLPGIGEVHHLMETAHTGHYTSGTVTAVPSLILAVWFVRAVI